MELDREGNVDMFSRSTLRVMIEFDFDMQKMADEIEGLRQIIDEKDKEITQLANE